MMADGGGFFGGLSEGYDAARARAAQQQQVDQQGSYQQGMLRLQEQQQQHQQQRELYNRADKDVASLMTTASSTIEALQQQGKDPTQIAKAIQPIVQAAKRLRQSSGGDPSAIDAQVSVALAKPFIPSQEMAKPTKMGSGLMGEETYGSYNPKSGKYEPLASGPSDLPAQPSGTGPRPPGQNLTDQNIIGVENGPAEALDSKGNVISSTEQTMSGQGARGDAALNAVPDRYRAMVKAVGDYELDAGKLLARGKPEVRAQFLSWVKEYNPTFDMKDYGAANDSLKKFTSGKESQTVRSFNVLVSHLDTLEGVTKALKNKDTNLLNTVKNKWEAQTGVTAPVTFDAVKEIVGDELVKAIIGGGGALGDREAIKSNVNSARSEKQLMDVIAKYKELAAGQLTGLRKTYEEGTKRKDFDRFLLPETKAAFEAKTVKSDHPASGPVDWQTYFGGSH